MAGAVAAGLGCAAVLAPVANGALTYSATGPSTLNLPGVQTVTAALTFENTGATTETVDVGGDAPQMQSPRAGATMDPQGYPTLQNIVGTSTVTGFSSVTASFPAGLCLAVVPDNTTGVYGNPGYGISLSVPPGARGVITQPFRVGDFPARPGDSFAVQFRVRDSSGQTTIFAPAPQLTGPAGLNINLSVPPVVGKRQRSFVVNGSTNPALPGQVVNIQMNDAVEPLPVPPTIGSATTDSLGNFSLSSLLPKKGGSYSIGATYTSQSPSFASDTACGTRVALPARPAAKKKKKGKKKRKKHRKR